MASNKSNHGKSIMINPETIHFNRTSFSASDKATKRALAPYVKVMRKGQKETLDLKEDKYFSYYVQKKPSVLMQNLSDFLLDSIDLPSLLLETADVLKSVTKSHGVVLYTVDAEMSEIVQCGEVQAGRHHKARWKIEAGKTVATFVALNKEYVMVDDVIKDSRFPEGIGWKGFLVQSVLCVPVITPDGDCFAVIELYRDTTSEPFNINDLKIVIIVTGWMGAAIHQNQQRQALQKREELNDYLLDLTQCYFIDNVSLEKMITEIMSFAKETLNAERASFFIIDKTSTTLEADFFDDGISPVKEKMQMHKKKMKIQLGKDRSIAGYVAKTGQTVNLIDAYNDSRFNKEIDQKTGCITRSILCMPILGMDGIIGIMQVINKKSGNCFSENDQALFKTFSIYCTIILHYNKVYSSMEKQGNINKIINDMLIYHMKPSVDREASLFDYTFFDDTTLPDGFNEFWWYISEEYETDMPKLILHMICEIIGENFCDINVILQFIEIVKKSYRNNPYHNFEHAFTVCHCMYNILMRNADLFNQSELKGLIIAALCHDLDHKGVSNNFLHLIDDPLIQLYHESPLENHHFFVTMIILNNCKLFTNMDTVSYKEMIQEIKNAILATDLASFFRCRTQVLQIIADGNLEWTDNNHRTLTKSIIMTSCDLSGQCKPYCTTKKITDLLYKEFYAQGDKEKSLGLTPLSMLDRDKPQMIPEDQVQFLNVVCLPCTELLKSILPNTNQLYIQCRELRDTWKEIIDLHGQDVWKPDDSYIQRASEK